VVSRQDENNDADSVGSWLQNARESRGESLDEVSRVTRIGKGYLIAIEQGEMHKLPSEAYAKGFVRLYATHLGLSGDEAVARLSGVQAPVAGNQSESVPRPAAVVGTKDAPGRSGFRRWGIPLTLLFFLIVSALILRQRDDEPKPPPVAVPVVQPQPSPGAQITPQPASPTGEPVSPQPPAVESSDTAASATESIQTGGIILRLKAVQTGKLHITIDGAVSQEYDLNVGDLVEWKAEKMFLLDLDNAGSVEGELNGRPLQPFGEQGRAAHLVIRADGIHNE